MNIKQASELTGVSTDMLRYYEKIGIIKPKRDKENNYRDYIDSDIYTIVMIRQYSQIGLSLKTIKKLLVKENIETILDELESVEEYLSSEVDLIKGKLDNARLLLDVFTMIKNKEKSVITSYHNGYFYPRIDEKSVSIYNNLYKYGGAARTVFRINHNNLYLDKYPIEQGIYAAKKLPNNDIPYLEIKNHRHWCTFFETNNESIITYKEIKPYLQIMKDEGYELKGDIFLSQVMTSSNNPDKTIVLMECDIG